MGQTCMSDALAAGIPIFVLRRIVLDQPVVTHFEAARASCPCEVMAKMAILLQNESRPTNRHCCGGCCIRAIKADAFCINTRCFSLAFSGSLITPERITALATISEVIWSGGGTAW